MSEIRHQAVFTIFVLFDNSSRSYVVPIDQAASSQSNILKTFETALIPARSKVSMKALDFQLVLSKEYL
jgi:hypothetical protein